MITNPPAPVNLPTSTPSFPLLSSISPPTNSSSNFAFAKNKCPKTKLHQEHNAIDDLEKKIVSKVTNLQGQDLARHRVVLSFLKIQI